MSNIQSKSHSKPAHRSTMFPMDMSWDHMDKIDGRTALSGSSEYPYGPYIKDAALPPNPFNHKDNLVCDYDEADITQRDSGGADAGWKFYPRTGVLIAADGEHDTD